MEKETIKKTGNIELIKYSNGKFGIIARDTGEESGPRYRTEHMAELIFRQWVREDEICNS